MNINKLQTAIELTQNGKFKEAENLFLEITEEEPENSKVLSAFGLFYISQGIYTKAIYYLKKASVLEKTLGTLSALGFAEFDARDYENSAIHLEEALKYGENPDIYNRLIASLFEIQSGQKAVEFSDKMYALYPNNSKAISNKVKALSQIGKLQEAEKLCVDSLKVNPNIPSLWHHLGFLKELIYKDDSQACECFKIASNLGSKNADYNIAVSYQKQGYFEEAEKYYKKMLSNFPNHTITKVSLGMCYLKQRRFEEGYELFYQRESRNVKSFTNNLWIPKTPIKDEIVIIGDQGFGDNIQFVRYLPFFKDKKVKVAVREELQELFKQNYPEFEFINFNNINPKTQSFRITDLAYVLDMDFENIPFSEGYLKSKNLEIKSDKKKIGLCWEAGSSGHRTMLNRTINPEQMEPLMNIDNVQLYSLQYQDSFCGNEKYPQMVNLAKDFKDFNDTAKAIKSMDLIITADTAVAHLAGALGVKTFLLLPYVSDWRWFDDKNTTPWYKSIKIIQQTDPNSWQNEINELLNLLSCKNI